MDFGYNFGGVLTDFDGAMVALWASYAKPVAGEVRDMVRGLPAGPIENARDEVLSWRPAVNAASGLFVYSTRSLAFFSSQRLTTTACRTSGWSG